MTLKSFAFTALFVGIGLTVSAPLAAQGRNGPANIPPASFEGLQFVDNRGCVYVRAGFDGNVTWVPRVTRQRQPICGQSPTFSGASASVAPPAAAPRQAPVQITLDPAPAPAPVAPVAAAAATTAVAAAAPRVARPAPVTIRRAASAPVQAPPVVRAPSSKTVAVAPRIVRKAPAAAPAAEAPIRTILHPCAVHSGMVERKVGGKTVMMRCAPQSRPHVDHEGLARALAGNTRIIPKHVYDQRVQELGVKVPYGYRPAWQDDRLNPHRAVQTVDGHKATQQIWSNTVPRESVVTAKRNAPSTPVVVGRTVAHSGVVTGAAAERSPTVSTRSAPVAATQYVHVGAFSTEGKARVAASRLQAAGLPVRFGRGKGMTHVMVGPYAPGADAARGLQRTHATGYVQAYLR